VVLPPQRRARPPPYTGKVLKEKADSWHHGLSPSSRQDWLESILLALKNLADAGLGTALVLANLHHQRIIPLMERELRIYEMSETANPVSLARSRLLHDHFPLEYAATRTRCAISLKAVRHGNDDLWSFVMLPDAPPGSRLPPFLYSSAMRRCDSDISPFLAEGGREHRTFRPAHTPIPSARGAATQEGAKDPTVGAPGTAGQGIPAARAAGALSPGNLGVLIVGRGRRGRKRWGASPPERWEPAPPSPRAVEAAEGQAPWGGRGSARPQAVYGRGGARRGGTTHESRRRLGAR
jgi:hypothetical protein